MTTGPITYQCGILYCLLIQNQEEFDIFLKEKHNLLPFDAFFFNLYKFAVQVLSQTIEKKLVSFLLLRPCSVCEGPRAACNLSAKFQLRNMSGR